MNKLAFIRKIGAARILHHILYKRAAVRNVINDGSSRPFSRFLNPAQTRSMANRINAAGRAVSPTGQLPSLDSARGVQLERSIVPSIPSQYRSASSALRASEGARTDAAGRMAEDAVMPYVPNVNDLYDSLGVKQP